MSGPTGVDWTTALLVLAVGLVLGTVLVWRVLGRARAAAAADPPDDLKRRDLEAKRDALLAQLRELDDTQTKRTDEQLARERYALELEAARTLVALGAGAVSETAPPVTSRPSATKALTPTATGGDRAAMRGFLWGTLSAGGVGLLLFFLYTQARPREEGGSLTGEIPGGVPGGGAPPAAGTSGGSGPPADTEEARVRQAVARNPDDLDAHMALARLLLARQDMMGVWNETKLVLERSPGHPQALAYQALVRLAMGQGDQALELLQESLRRDPDLIDAYVHMALVYVRLGRTADAEEIVNQAARRFPDQAGPLRKLLQELQQGQTQQAQAASGATDPHADPHAGLGLGTPGGEGRGAVAEPAPSAGRAASSGKRIAGTVELDPALAGQVGAGGILFVFVREAGFGAGPPVAARRLPVSSFPVAFEIGEGDAMMGQPFPDDLLVEARLDADGDPTTRLPSDPKARIDDVKAGTTTVRLVLKRAS